MPAKDAMQLYLRDIGEIPLLSKEEEMRLARKYLARRRGSKEAKKTLIKSNLRLVVALSRRYAHLGVPYLDLIEEGNLGLIKAIEKYDPTKGARIGTYASWWIKQAVIRSIASQGKTIRLPVYMMERMVTINKAKQVLKHKLGRPPKLKEIAKKVKLPMTKVKEVEMVTQTFSSLHASVDEDGVGELVDIIEDVDAIMPSREVSAAMLYQDMLDLLGVLNEREEDIITMRFGLKGQFPKTLADIGKKYRLTRERVRQIESESIKKMKKFLKQQRRDFHSYWAKK